MVLLTGCQSPDGETDDGTGPDPIEPVERQPLTLYLQLPFPCPDQPFPVPGNTTYNATMPISGCERDEAEALLDQGSLCGLFQVHDPTVKILQGDALTGDVSMNEVGGVDVTRRYVWRDDAGTIAEARGPAEPVSRAGGQEVLSTTASRDSQGIVWFDVHSDNGHCHGVAAGGADNSNFRIEQAGS